MSYDGDWWRDPMGLTMIMRSQGTLDEDEFIIENPDDCPPLSEEMKRRIDEINAIRNKQVNEDEN